MFLLQDSVSTGPFLLHELAPECLCRVHVRSGSIKSKKLLPSPGEVLGIVVHLAGKRLKAVLYASIQMLVGVVGMAQLRADDRCTLLSHYLVNIIMISDGRHDMPCALGIDGDTKVLRGVGHQYLPQPCRPPSLAFAIPQIGGMVLRLVLSGNIPVDCESFCWGHESEKRSHERRNGGWNEVDRGLVSSGGCTGFVIGSGDNQLSERVVHVSSAIGQVHDLHPTLLRCPLWHPGEVMKKKVQTFSELVAKLQVLSPLRVSALLEAILISAKKPFSQDLVVPDVALQEPSPCSLCTENTVARGSLFVVVHRVFWQLWNLHPKKKLISQKSSHSIVDVVEEASPILDGM